MFARLVAERDKADEFKKSRFVGADVENLAKVSGGHGAHAHRMGHVVEIPGGRVSGVRAVEDFAREDHRGFGGGCGGGHGCGYKRAGNESGSGRRRLGRGSEPGEGSAQGGDIYNHRVAVLFEGGGAGGESSGLR